ncbi:MAG TPA: DUF1932 domain-containing protein [Candidatus Binataceae bacterium]|nr:DUF1932 domain-containing protein [Candidatus Binataceae bacterium]
MSDRLQPIVAIVGAGEMGAAVGRRLRQSGARVLTSLAGRSGESELRVRQAELEVVDDDAALVRDADFVLSIVPPGVAVAVAERYRASLAIAARQPIFADCNAVSPATARRIGDVLAGCRYVDAGIIGGPPPADLNAAGPRFYASGPHAPDFAKLAEFGLDIAVLDGPIGAASGLKLSYAGLTKGITALGAAMVGAAARDGLGNALRSELARTQPHILARLERQIPAMFPKAYRWVAEMEEIAEFLGGDDRGAMIYKGAARLYEQIAAQNEGGASAGAVRALTDFCTKPATRLSR